MKKFAFLFILIAASLFAHDPKDKMAKCTGSKNCSACKNCRYCKYCNAGGVCGVCSPESFKPKKSNTTDKKLHPKKKQK